MTDVKKRPGFVPITPFRRWLLAEEARLANREDVLDPAKELARRLGTRDRYLFRWKRGLNGSDRPTRLIPFLTVAEILHAADVPFNDLYPRWCSACGAHCSGALKTGLCWTCYAESGSHTGRHNDSKPKLMDEGVLVRAQALYEEHGLSFRAIARRLIRQTGYANVWSMSNQLNVAARRRGWNVRERIEATRLASTTHGLAPRKKRTRAQKAHQRQQRVARGEITGKACEGKLVKRGREGEPCRRPALAGKRFCFSHDPERRAEIREILVDARARKNGGKPVHNAPRACDIL